MKERSLRDQYRVVIVGCGVSGIACAEKLLKSGITDFAILEKAGRVGGTWRDNTYPGCGCDVPSSLYSFSFNLNPQWSRAFAPQPEILCYIEHTVERLGLKRFIHMQTELLSSHWDAGKQQWVVKTNQGEIRAQFIVFAAGPITKPAIPAVPGLDNFDGEVFHSARWNHGCYLAGKRVAVIGTGASAIQFVPEIQPIVRQLYVFQRTPAWVFPRPNRHISKLERRLRDRFSQIDRIERTLIDKGLLAINYGLLHPWVFKLIEPQAKALLALQVRDPELRKKLTPRFTIGCKRMLFSNDYYHCLQQPNVELLASALTRVTDKTVVGAQGEIRNVDTIIFGTGYDVTRPPIADRIYCPGGELLANRWQREGPEAYLGTTLKDLPNAFLMVGPNILVYSSFIGIAEWQSGYIADAIVKASRHKIKTIRMSADYSHRYNKRVQRDLQGTVWNSGGCSSYYLDEQGRNFAAWPWTVPALREKLQRFDMENYVVNG